MRGTAGDARFAPKLALDQAVFFPTARAYDNASRVAGLIELARLLAAKPPPAPGGVTRLAMKRIAPPFASYMPVTCI